MEISQIGDTTFLKYWHSLVVRVEAETPSTSSVSSWGPHRGGWSARFVRAAPGLVHSGATPFLGADLNLMQRPVRRRATRSVGGRGSPLLPCPPPGPGARPRRAR